MSQLLLIIGLLVFAYACRTFANRYIAKLGWAMVLLATYLGAYFLTQSHLAGVLALAVWPLFPWVEIIGRVRKLRFPLYQKVTPRFPPSRDIFPDLEEVSQEVEQAGFTRADDAGWKWEGNDFFVRLFYCEPKKVQATICVAQQSDFVFSYASLTTRVSDGRSYVTTNYPFSFTMKLSPQQRMNRCESAENFEDMLTAHALFLQRQGVSLQDALLQDPEQLSEGLATDLSQQIDHNLSAGVIIRLDKTHFRYSWRGCFYLWCQVVKDMLRV